MTFITQEYDFYEAISKNFTQSYFKFAINNVTPISDNMSIVDTTHGKFHCESFYDDNKNIYMKVTSYL